jgi:hypothetical protein
VALAVVLIRLQTLDARVLRITVDTGVPVALDDQYIYSVPKALVADSLTVILTTNSFST